MGRLLDPDWSQFKYVPAAKTDLRESMERYKRIVNGENKNLRFVTKVGDNKGHHGEVPGEQVNSLQGHKFSVVRGKG